MSESPDTAWHQHKCLDVLQLLDSTHQGLPHEEANQRLARFGRNELPSSGRRTLVSIFFKQFLSPFIYLLLASAGVALALGEMKDALVILLVVLLNSVIGSFQEDRAERSLETLRGFSRLSARVRRSGIEKSLDAAELVPGDIIILSTGEAIPADGRILEAGQFTTGEAALTGESLPVRKSPEPLSLDTLLPDRKNMIYAGSFVHSGRCVAVVTATGLQNEIGKIARLASEAAHPRTQLESKVHRFGKTLMYASMPVCLAVIGVGWLRNIPMSEIVMISISQMVSLVPEGLPIAISVALAVGVQRMAKRGAVVRQLSAIETLGTVNVICSDKTGTLTRNEIIVTELFLPCPERMIRVTGTGYDPSGAFFDQGKEFKPREDAVAIQILRAGVLCNDACLLEPMDGGSRWGILGDPTEGALLVLAEKAGMDTRKMRDEMPRVDEIPFDPGARLMATRNRVDGSSVVFLKGAPEAILGICEWVVSEVGKVPISPALRSKVQSIANRMAQSGRRVLAFAQFNGIPIEKPLSLAGIQKNATLIGLVGQMDPPRAGISGSIRRTKAAGIRTILITGDHRATGSTIAANLGILYPSDLVIDGSELSNMSDQDLVNVIDRVSVFARASPEQKLRIVEALQTKGHTVAMTGDGVNDAPALMKADVGVAMGITGTEVAKEAAKVVIADDSFATLVSAISEGRLVHRNIKKLILFLFVTSLDEVTLLLLSLIFGYPLPLSAVQILWINLVTEGTLTITLIMEPAEGTEMDQPPVSREEPLLDSSLLRRIPLMVGSSAIATFGWLMLRSSQEIPADLLRSETFTLLAICQWFNVLNCRSVKQSVLSLGVFKNLWLTGGIFLSIVLQMAVIYLPSLQSLFRTVAIAPSQLLSMVIVASSVLWSEEIRKLMVRRWK